MGIQPNHQKLLVTGKQKNTQAQPEYATDMRTIENWANEGIVRSLHAGTNITLDPADGVDDGTGITISASGGGGGSAPAQAILTAGPDTATYNLGGEIVLGPSNPSGSEFVSFWDVFDNSGISAVTYTIATSWFVIAAGGQSIVFLPQIVPPFWSSGGMDALFQMNCSTLDFANTAQYQQTSLGTLASGTPFQPTAADYSAINTAGDITLTAGPGFTGNGLVTNGSDSPYLASVQLRLRVDAGTTFT